MLRNRGRAVGKVGWWILLAVKVVSAGLACLSNPCLHGICLDDVNSTLYSCYCVDGYTGIQCQTNWDECWSDPCLNGGTCVDGIATYNCSCPEGFIGDNCETNYNECESNPCLNNGTCIDMTNGYVCSCIPGFSGEHCEMDIAVCNSSEEIRCYNGGQCIEGPGLKFYCKCMPGWTGKKCEDQIDECESNPCLNGGVCIDMHADYLCACTYGFTGKSCEVTIEFCDENTCSNDALCVVEDGVAVCYCVPDYHGDKCELQYDECLLGHGCMNGGTCIDGIDNFTCSCPPKLTGSLCECLILDNHTQDCDYVSPSAFPITTQSILLTSVYERFSTTESITVSVSYNETVSVGTETTKDLWTTKPTSYPTTDFTEAITDHISKDTDLDTSESVTIVPEESTSVKTEMTTEVTDTNEPTLKIEDSKTETTTECKDFCEKSSDSTLNVPPKETATTFSETQSSTVTDAASATTIETTQATQTTVGESERTTPKMDTTTESLFTDAPTDHIITDSSTSTILTTLAESDVTTSGESTTSVYTSTVQTECTNSYCTNHGKCINTPHGIRCQCNFNYGGNLCEDKKHIKSAAFNGKSYIAHNLRNTTSIDIEFKAKTLIYDGQIMHVDIAHGVYMELSLDSGLLKFKFSCGYQTMLLSELKTFVNKGYLMKIETRLDLYPLEQHCNATLRLNATVGMSGGQVANISALNHVTTLYLGNRPDVVDNNKPFIGCISDLIVNGEGRETFGDAIEASEVSECSSLACLSGPCRNGGTCIDQGENFTCACANGWMGEECEDSVCSNNPCGSGGSCVRHPGSGFLCLCPYGKHGIFCEYNVEITRPSLSPISSGISSYLIYPLQQPFVNSDRFELRLRFQTTDMDQISLLAFVGQSGRHDSKSQHLALTFVKGYIMLTWNMGNGARRIFTSHALAARRGGHTVRVWRRGRAAGLAVDARHNVSGHAPGPPDATHMALLPYIYIGGHPSVGFSGLPHDLPLHGGWRGCVWDAGARPAAARGVGQCGVAQCAPRSCNAPRGLCIHSPATYGCVCNEGWFGATCSAPFNPCDKSRNKCKGYCVITANDAQCDCSYGKTGEFCDQDLIHGDVLFSGVRSYIKLKPSSISSVSLAFEAEVKLTRERGLVLFVETPHFYTSLSLQGGLLEYRWTDRVSGVTSLVRSGVVVSLGGWHRVKAGRYGSRLYVWLDGALATDNMLTHTMPHTATHSALYIGGLTDLSKIPFDAISGPPEYFSGCIRNVHLNNVFMALDHQNVEEGRNLGDCGGAACSGAGARCRRQPPPTCGASCRTPRGACRRARCVCAAGYAGHDCEQSVNVTIPQFSGESLLSLARKSLDGQRSEQRLGAALRRPDFVSLNFTTAEPDGLLFWSSMDLDFLGIGLENGYLKLVWSFHNQNTSNYDIDDVSKLPDPSRAMSKVIPNAGYLGDAEWHVLVLRLDTANVTVTVDQTLAYIEEPGIVRTDYDDVDVYIGGINKEDSAKARTIFPQNFKGCIDDISTKEQSSLTNYNELYSENINSCQLFP